VLYYIKVRKFIKLAYIVILEDFRVLYYIKVMKFAKLAYIGILEDFLSALSHKSQEVRIRGKF